MAFNYYFFLTLIVCSLVSINIQGLRSPDRCTTAFNFFKKQKYDIIFLQETHWTPDIQDSITRTWGGPIYFNNGNDSARGVAILFNPRLNYTLLNTHSDATGRILALHIKLDDQHINLVNIYAPSTDTNRRAFYSEIEHFLSTNHDNIIGGDFNSITDPRIDKEGGNPTPRQYATQLLNDVTSRFDLVDIWQQRHPNAREFTWTGRNTRNNNSLIRTRIDKFYTAQTLNPQITTTSIVTYPHSDHDLIHLTLDFDSQPRGPGYWHFNNTLLDDAIFGTDIRDFWNHWLTQKQHYETPLRWWEQAKIHFKHIAIKRAKVKRKIESHERTQLTRQLDTLRHKAASGNSIDAENFLHAKNKLKELDLRELEAVKIRAKARFLEEGEQSTRYFYSLEKHRQADQSITTLTRDNLDTITDTRDLLSETRQFYQSLYTADELDPDAQQSFFQTQIPQLSHNAQSSCETSLTTAELEKALKSMENNKSPGFDGLTTNFYKHFWPILGPKLTQVFNFAFNNGTLTSTQRRGIITLLFKKGDRTHLKNWRPITLLTTDYKILTKTLANRLTNVLSGIIHTDQTACIPGRTINDNLSLIRDTILYANETNTPLALVSIDQMKAFDRISHSFLFSTLEHFGFGPNFIKWIKLIYTSTFSAVKLNGWLTSFIPLERSTIRANPYISGLSLPGFLSPLPCISQYADDTSLIVGTERAIEEVFNVYSLYERGSGAKLNPSKCEGLWLGPWNGRTDSPVNIIWSSVKIKVLGVFLGPGNLDEINWRPRITSVENALNSWRQRSLSYRGKALVINALALSRVWYVASLIPVPPWVLSELTSLVFKFFWSGKRDLNARMVVCQPSFLGGFSVVDCQTKLWALRVQWVRRFVISPASWSSFMIYWFSTVFAVPPQMVFRILFSLPLIPFPRSIVNLSMLGVRAMVPSPLAL